MTLEKLKESIAVWKVPESLYSINDGLKPDAYIVLENYDKWDFFYLAEKGDTKLNYIFNNSSDAYDFLWEKLFEEVQYTPSIPPGTVYP